VTCEEAIILAAHGAGDESRVNRRVRALARDVEARLNGPPVVAAFNLGAPRYAEAARRLGAARTLVIPLMASRGYFATRVLAPAVRGACAGRAVRLTPPLGAWAEIQRAVVHDVRAVVDDLVTAQRRPRILIVGHGTSRHPDSGETTLAAAALIGDETGVRADAAFLDQSPTIEAALRRSEMVALVVAPLLFGAGPHETKDVARRVREGIAHWRRAPQIRFTRPIVALDALPRLIAARARHEFAQWTAPIRLGARGSDLSRAQVEIVRGALRRRGRDSRFVEISTRGDRDLGRPIEGFPGGDPFTREITQALLTGRVDAGVHSLKDLPVGGDGDDAELETVFPRRGAPGEALVSRDGAPLCDLPFGACVGTSSARRAAQVLAIRPDLRLAPVRGAVPARIAAVDRGELDAVVLAVAGLERLGLENRIAERFPLEEFVPAPGQGATAVQFRSDAPEGEVLRSLDDAATRRSVAAELLFAASVGAIEGFAAAAVAFERAGRLHLQARLLLLDGALSFDETVQGEDPSTVGDEAAARLLNDAATVEAAS